MHGAHIAMRSYLCYVGSLNALLLQGASNALTLRRLMCSDTQSLWSKTVLDMNFVQRLSCSSAQLLYKLLRCDDMLPQYTVTNCAMVYYGIPDFASTAEPAFCTVMQHMLSFVRLAHSGHTAGSLQQ
jgi:phage pi2 protein 07